MKKFLAFLCLAFFMLVGCDSPLELADRGTIKATKMSNGDWVFDIVGLNIEGKNTEWYITYSSGENGDEVADISVSEEWDGETNQYTGVFSGYASAGGTEANDIPVGGDHLILTVPASSGFVFNADAATWAYVTVKTLAEDGSTVKGAYWQGNVTKGSGEVEVVGRGESVPGTGFN